MCMHVQASAPKSIPEMETDAKWQKATRILCLLKDELLPPAAVKKMHTVNEEIAHAPG